jgi:lipid-A-disaccharide synthase
MKQILLVAGELSGDMHGAELIRDMQAQDPDVTFFGVGGDNCRAAGMELLYHTDDTAVMGFVEVLKHIRFFKKMFYHLLEELDARKPDAVVLIDYPGFNLRFAAQARARGVKVIYYVCPQVWAWHRERIPKMARTIDRLITIFPFEAAHFEGTGLDVAFAGHPLVDAWEMERRAPPPDDLPWGGEQGPRIALLPGSRRNEINRLADLMVDAAALIKEQLPTASFIIASPSQRAEAILADALRERQHDIPVVMGRTRAVLRTATAALVASGTATIETALAHCPQVVTYRVAPLTYQLCKRLIQIPYIGMVNVVANQKLCPELIQHKATPVNMAAELLPLLSDTEQRTRMLEGLKAAAASLGAPGTHARAAALTLEALNN